MHEIAKSLQSTNQFACQNYPNPFACQKHPKPPPNQIQKYPNRFVCQKRLNRFKQNKIKEKGSGKNMSKSGGRCALERLRENDGFHNLSDVKYHRRSTNTDGFEFSTFLLGFLNERKGWESVCYIRAKLSFLKNHMDKLVDIKRPFTRNRHLPLFEMSSHFLLFETKVKALNRQINIYQTI